MGKAAGEMMLDEPGGVIAQPVGDIDLLQYIMEHLLFDGGCASAHRHFEENPEIPLRHLPPALVAHEMIPAGNDLHPPMTSASRLDSRD
jgi:hypothetical protein